jgi:hypothetical protein
MRDAAFVNTTTTENDMSIITDITDGHTYHSTSKGVLKIAEMVTEHIENAIAHLTHTGEQPQALAAMKTELATRQTAQTQEAAQA